MMKKSFTLFAIAAVTFAAVFAFVGMPAKKAQAVGLWYGGLIVSYTPPTLICPGITTIADIDTTGAISMVNVYRAPLSQVYAWYNIYTPGAWVEGTLVPVPYPTCPVPVFPIFEIGTSAGGGL